MPSKSYARSVFFSSSSSSLIACFDYPLGPFLACSLINVMGMSHNGLKRIKSVRMNGLTWMICHNTRGNKDLETHQTHQV